MKLGLIVLLLTFVLHSEQQEVDYRVSNTDHESLASESDTKAQHAAGRFSRLHGRKPHKLDEYIRKKGKSLPTREYREPPCPLAEDIYPCTCEVDARGPSLYCSLVTHEDLAAIFQKDFPVKEFIGLYIFDSPLLEYLENIFNGVSFFVVEFENVGLSVVSEDCFADSNSTLDSLVLYYTQLDNKGFPFSSLSMYTNLFHLYILGGRFTSVPEFQSETLRTLTVSFCDISTIGAGALNGFTDLREAYFETNNIHTLEAGSFVGCPLLTDVDLNSDRITELVANTFELQNQFNAIRLRNNMIASVEAGSFIIPSETDGLDLFLDLESNQLTTVSEEVFGPLFPFISRIYLAGNPLRCDCGLSWLISNPGYMASLQLGASCEDGTFLSDLDPGLFNNCTGN